MPTRSIPSGKILLGDGRSDSFRGNADVIYWPSVGIVGARNATVKAQSVAADAAAQCAGRGVAVVSGNDRGIDHTAHLSALEVGGATILVLAQGLGGFYLRESLRVIADWRRLLLISQWSDNQGWQAWRAMKRNETICQLSDAAIVAQAAAVSGTMSTGLAAQRMGISLHVAVYKEQDEKCYTGNRELLAAGASSLQFSVLRSQANMSAVWQDVARAERKGTGREKISGSGRAGRSTEAITSMGSCSMPGTAIQ